MKLLCVHLIIKLLAQTNIYNFSSKAFKKNLSFKIVVLIKKNNDMNVVKNPHKGGFCMCVLMMF